jgi:VTC domain
MPNGTGTAAYEMKFGVSEQQAVQLQEWAKAHLELDPHADPVDGYQITSIYFDTPAFDVFRRNPGYDINKYRLRRYGLTNAVHLERKSKQDGRIWKCRESMNLADLSRPRAEWPVSWFKQELDQLQLQPMCAATYQRLAFLGNSSSGSIRLTLDRKAYGRVQSDHDLTPALEGFPLVTDLVIVEFKYLATLPSLFKSAIEQLQLQPTGVSKFRRCLRAAGLISTEGSSDV